MHDPKFEIEVQQKMEELSFVPSDAVWAKVEAKINKDSNRRSPLFWIFLLLGLGLTGAGTYVLFTRQPLMRQSLIRQPISSSGTRVAQHQSQADQTPSTAPEPNFPVAASANPRGEKRNSRASEGLHTGQNESLPTGRSERLHNKKDHELANGQSDERSGSRQQAGAGVHGKPGFREEKQNEQVAGQPSVNAEMKKPAPVVIVNFRPSINMVYPAIPGKGIVAAIAGKVAKKPSLEKPAKWEAGFTGGIGIADVEQNLAAAKSAYDNRNVQYAAAAPISRATPDYPPSDMKPGISYTAGIFVQRPVLKSANLSIGLNLHYYSTGTPTGDRVDNTSSLVQSAASSLFYSSAAAPQVQSYPYYMTGQSHTFTNKYYFLELPVALQLPLNHSRRLPLMWEGGLSVSRLVSFDAIYFDQGTGVYYKERDAYMKTQVNVFTSVMVRLPWLGGQVQVGPQLGYGLTNLFNQKVDPGHLLYGGIKFTLIAGRRK